MITKKDLKGLSKRELKEMLCLASQWCEECGLVLEFRDCSMEFAGKEINDECVHCGEILECELFKQGHGIRQERTNVVQMFSCQMKHREKRNE